MYTWGILLAYICSRLSSRLQFYVFWEAGHDRVFLVSESGLLKKDLVHTSNWKQAIVTMQCTYAIHTIILTPLGIDCPPFKYSSLWSFDLSDCISSSRVILVPSWFLLFLSILFSDLVSWNLLLHFKVGSRDQSTQRKRGGPMIQWGEAWKIYCLDTYIA